MKILLIDPPFKSFTGFANFYYPIGLGYLAAALRKESHQVDILDVDALNKTDDIDFSDEYKRLELYRQGLNDNEHQVWQQIKKALENYHPDLVGITAMTPKFGSVLKVAELVKRWNSNCLVIAGGPHPTLLPEQTLKSKNIDIIVRDEGEATFLELVKALELPNFQITQAFSQINGISYKINNEIVHNLPREFIKDLDTIAFPAREALMNPEKYTSEDMGVIMSARGCPFNCTYCCHFWQRRIRSRSVDNVLQEIKHVKEQYATTQFEFKDDSFTLNKKWVVELCDKMVAQKLKINWGCSTRVDLLDEELIKKMKKAGCNVVKLGIETGSERILQETKKGVTFDQMKQIAKLLNKYRLFWSGYFMMGLPTETEEDIKKTYEFVKELNPYYAGLGVYNPFPKTELFNKGVEMGLLYENVPLNHFFETNPKDYFFINPDKRTLNIPKEKFDELTIFMMDAFHKHNTQLKNIIRRGWSRKKSYYSQPGLFFKHLKTALKWVMQK